MNGPRMTRREFLVWLFGGLASSTGIYSTIFERYWLKVSEAPLYFSRLPKKCAGMRILHFTDLHYGFFLGERMLSTVVNEINRLKPHIVCFTGDLIDSIDSPIEEVVPYLQQIEAPHGKFAVLGNHDYNWRTRIPTIAPTYKRCGFRLLVNDYESTEFEGVEIDIVGVDDWYRGTPNITQALENTDPSRFKILLAHEPDYADVAAQFPIDLQLSGHSHGGQVRLPLWGALTLPRMGKIYPDGIYKQWHSRMVLHTSRGIGTTTLPIRFYCRPEMTLFTLYPVD